METYNFVNCDENSNNYLLLSFIFREKSKNWIGTISGTLSHSSQSLFKSGMESFNEAGWWKLRHKKNPKQYYEYSKYFHLYY